MRIPNVTFKTRIRDESIDGPNPYRWENRTTDQIFLNRNVVLFALPGAFTPTCSSTHLPRYEELHDNFRALGVDEVICLSVNDAFVMFQWRKHQNVKKVTMLPDGSALFKRRMGMLVTKDNLGFGMRSWRYSLYAEDGEILKMFVESGFDDECPVDPFDVSDADTMLEWLTDCVGVKQDAIKAA